MDEGEASEGGEGRGGGEEERSNGSRQCAVRSIVLTQSPPRPTSQQSAMRSGGENAITDGWASEGGKGRGVGRGGSASNGVQRCRAVPPIASPHPRLDLRNQLMIATGEDTMGDGKASEGGKGGGGGDVRGKE